MACIEIGTSWMLSLRRWAVTVISCSASGLGADSLLLLAGVSAADAPRETLPRIAATAYETFDFIAIPPRACFMSARDPKSSPGQPGDRLNRYAIRQRVSDRVYSKPGPPVASP